MKKILCLISALALMFAASCEKPEEQGGQGGNEQNSTPELIVDRTVYSVGNGEGVLNIPVDATSKSVKVSVVGDAKDWISYKETKAETKAELETHFVVVSYATNPIATAREGSVTISLDNLSETVTIKQAAAKAKITLSETSKRMNPRGDSFIVKVTANDDYTVTPSADWLTCNKETGEIKATLNGSGAFRTGKVVFTSKAEADVTAEVTVTQKAANVDPELIHVLAIGDSFIDDYAPYFLGVLGSLGYTKIHIANLPFDGKSLAEVATALNGKEKVAIHACLDGANLFAADTLVSEVLTPDDWDVIVIQPSFDKAGEYDAASIASIVNTVRSYCEFTPLYWNMTWAYKATSTAEAFKNYGSDQMAMYTAVANVAEQVSANKEFEGIIPLGTLIQNIRTSYIEDNVTSDDAHLSVNIGQLAAAYMWAQTLTGKNPLGVASPFIPALRYDPDCVPAMQEAYANALTKPFEVTAATQYPPYVLNVAAADANALITAAGFKPEDYVAAPFIVMHYGFYNSSNGNYLTCSVFKGSNDGNMNKFAATHIIPKAEIPNGSLIVVLDGYQYRPEGWVTLDTKNDGKDGRPSRPGNVTDSVIEVNDTWWGTFTYRAFNISKTSGNPTADEMKAIGTKFGIYLPKTAVNEGLEDYINGEWKW